MNKIWFFLFGVMFSISNTTGWTKSLSATTPAETHKFHVLAKAQYRCYAGYDGKKVTDERTQEICDNKISNSTIVDKIVSIKIDDEADPGDSKELDGSWLEEFKFKGRKFVIAITLFKDSSPNPYRMNCNKRR